MKAVVSFGIAVLGAMPASAQGQYDKAWEMMAQASFVERNCPGRYVEISDPDARALYEATVRTGQPEYAKRLAEAEIAANRDVAVRQAMCLMIEGNLAGPVMTVRKR